MAEHTITLNLDDKHHSALEALAEQQDMSKSAVLRSALRLYQMVTFRLRAGEQLAFTRDGKVVPIIPVGLMPLQDEES